MLTRKSSPKRPLVERELDVERARELRFHRGDRLVGEALGLQRRMVDAGRLAERAVADGIGLDLGDLGRRIAEHAQRFRHGAVDDLEVAAAGELLELHQREVGLDAGGVAVHHQADGAGRRHHRDLRVAEAVAGAELDDAVPGALGVVDHAGLRAGLVVERHRRRRDRLIAGALAVSRAAVVAHHPQHGVAVLLVAGEGAKLLRHLGRGRVADAGEDRGQRAADLAAGVAVIGNAGRHQQAADIGVAEAERAELVGAQRDLLRRELRHQHRDLEHHRPQPHRMLVAFDVEHARLALAQILGQEREQVHRREIAGGVVEEHVFRARVRRDDRTRGRAGVPVVDGGVELQAGIGRGPGGVADLLPEIARFDCLGDLAGLGAPGQVPVLVGFDGFQELVGDAHRVVGVLAGDGEVGLRIPIGVVDREVDVLVALLGELDDALDVVVRHVVAARRFDLAAQHRVLLRVEAIVARALAIDAGLEHRAQVLLVDLGAGDQRRDLLLFLHLPVDELLDVGMVGVDDHHLGGASGRSAGLDRAGGAVADLEERHQAGRLAAAGEALAFAAQRGEVGAGAGAVFEQPRLAHPQIHDAALVDEVVGDRLDEAGVRLRMLVGRFRLHQLAGLEVDVVVALARAVDAVGPVQAGVEPLRRVRRRHLHRQHVDELVEEGARVDFAVEMAALPAPIGPGAGEPLEHLLGRPLADIALLLRQRLERVFVGHRAPQPGRNGFFLDALEPRRHAGLAEIFLRDDVGGDLRPGGGHFHVLGVKHDRAVGVANLAGGQPERDARVRRLALCGVTTLDPHFLRPFSLGRWPADPSAVNISHRHLFCARSLSRSALSNGSSLTNACPAISRLVSLVRCGAPGAVSEGRKIRLRRRCGSGVATPNPVRRAPGGYEKPLAPNSQRLGRLCCCRQDLAAESESTTKACTNLWNAGTESRGRRKYRFSAADSEVRHPQGRHRSVACRKSRRKKGILAPVRTGGRTVRGARRRCNATSGSRCAAIRPGVWRLRPLIPGGIFAG